MKPTLFRLKSNGTVWLGEDPATSSARSLSIPFGIPEIDSFLPCGGLPLGTLHEWRCEEDFPPLSFFALLAAQGIKQSKKKILWIDQAVWPLPHYLRALSPALLERSYFIKTRSELQKLWLLDQSARTKGIGLLIAPIDSLSVSTLKRLSIAAKNSGVVLLLFKRNASSSSASASWLTRWKVSFAQSKDAYPHFHLFLSAYKGMGTECGEWRIRFNVFNPEVIALNQPATQASKEEQHVAREKRYVAV